MIEKDLLLRGLIVLDTHDDFDICATCYVGFNDERNLVVQFEYINFTDRSDDFIQEAAVDKDATWILAQKMKTHLLDLPQALVDKFGGPLNEVSTEVSDVKNTFDEILSFITGYRLDYKLRKIH